MTTSELTIQPIAKPDEAIKAWNRIYSDDGASKILEYLAIQLALGMVEHDSVREAMEHGPLRGLQPVRGFIYKLARLSDRLAEERLVDIINSDHEAAEFLLRHPAAVIALKRQEAESKVSTLPLGSAVVSTKPRKEPKVTSRVHAKRNLAAYLVLARWVPRAALVLASAGLGGIAGHQLATTRDQPSPMREILIARLTPVTGQDRSGDGDRIETKADGSFAIQQEFYSLSICSPRSGIATIVLTGPGQPIVYPKGKQEPIRVEAEKPLRYPAMPTPRSRTTVIVVITEPDATAIIRTTVEASSTIAGDPLESRIRDSLWKAGRSWVAINQVIIEPTSRPAPKP
jgi:hypothetical protein